MFESIQGILKDKLPTRAIVEANGIGYRLQIPLSTYSHLPEKEKSVFLYLSQVVREDAHTLYGFYNKDERDLFELLITISGVGPKTAVALIGHVEINTFQRAIATSDIRLLSKLPGIGKKTAERLVIEMRDKLKVKPKEPLKTSLTAKAGSLEFDAISALMNLGYSPNLAEKAVYSALKEEKELDNLGLLITAALQKI